MYFRRVQGDQKGNWHDHWFGVARVIGHEITNPERLDDPLEAVNHGDSSHGVWLRYKQGTVLAAPEIL